MARKMKKSKSKKNQKPRQEKLYRLVPNRKVNSQRGQAPVIYTALRRLGKASRSQLAAATRGKLKSRQTPEKVVGFYLTTWKSKGLVCEA